MQQYQEKSDIEPDAVAFTVTNVGTDFVYLNDKAAELYGYPKEELLDMNAYDIIADPRERITKDYAAAISGDLDSVTTEIVTGDGERATVTHEVDRIEIDGEPHVLATFDSVNVLENHEQSGSKGVDAEAFDDINKDQLERITKNVRVDAPSGEMPLNAIMLDLLAGHNEIEQYKKGSLSLYDAIQERLDEEKDLNPDSPEVAVLEEVASSVFGLYLRIQRGDEELHGNRDGKYSGYFE